RVTPKTPPPSPHTAMSSPINTTDGSRLISSQSASFKASLYRNSRIQVLERLTGLRPWLRARPLDRVRHRLARALDNVLDLKLVQNTHLYEVLCKRLDGISPRPRLCLRLLPVLQCVTREVTLKPVTRRHHETRALSLPSPFDSAPCRFIHGKH